VLMYRTAVSQPVSQSINQSINQSIVPKKTDVVIHERKCKLTNYMPNCKFIIQ